MCPVSPDSRLSAAGLASGAKWHVKTLSNYPQTCKQTFTQWRKRLGLRKVRGADGSGQATIAGTSAPFKSFKARLGHNLLRGSRAHSATLAGESGSLARFYYSQGNLFRSISNPSLILSHKRKVNWDGEDNNGISRDANSEIAAPNKKSRICGESADDDEVMLLAQASPCNNNKVVDRMQICSSSASITSTLAKWYHPHTSPLGPQTSVYRRRSRCFPQPAEAPGKVSNNLAIRCLMQAFELNNRQRNPYKETAQWCEDLHLTGLNELFHPAYICEHPYHPSDPEYDEELDNDTWDEEEWSDSDGEDEVTTLSDGNDDQVKIISSADDSDQTAMTLDGENSSKWPTWNPSTPNGEQCLAISSAWKPDMKDINMQIVAT